MFSVFCRLSCLLVSCHILFIQVSPSQLWLPQFLFPSIAVCNIFLVASFLSCFCTCPSLIILFSGPFCHLVHVCLFLVFPLAHRNMHISLVCNFLSSFFLTAQHSAPYMAGFIAVLYALSSNFVGMFLSHITPVVSLHFDEAIFILLFTYFSASPLASNNEPRYLTVFT